jgi:hypothetical protein
MNEGKKPKPFSLQFSLVIAKRGRGSLIVMFHSIQY